MHGLDVTVGSQLQKFVRPTSADLVEHRIRRSARMLKVFIHEAVVLDDELTAEIEHHPWLSALVDQAEIDWATNVSYVIGRYTRGDEPSW